MATVRMSNENITDRHCFYLRYECVSSDIYIFYFKNY